MGAVREFQLKIGHHPAGAYLPMVWLDANGVSNPKDTVPTTSSIQLEMTRNDFDSGPDIICFKSVLRIEGGCAGDTSGSHKAYPVRYKVYKIAE